MGNLDNNAAPAPVGSLIQDEGVVLASDLARARELLRDAMGKIAIFVQLLQTSAARARSLAQSNAPPADATEIRRVLDSVQVDATNAILGLQVEDVLGQLIEQMQKRVGTLSDIGASLAELVAQRPSLSPSVERVKAALEEMQAERVRVSQTSLDAGEAELF